MDVKGKTELTSPPPWFGQRPPPPAAVMDLLDFHCQKEGNHGPSELDWSPSPTAEQLWPWTNDMASLHLSSLGKGESTDNSYLLSSVRMK